MPDDELDSPVLIVGAGPVGLTTALALARLGIRSLILERRSGISPHPRARFINARSMEIFRRLGIETQIRAKAIPDGVASDVVWAPNLSAPEVRRVEIETLGPGSGEPYSPASGVCTSQDVLDPILHDAVLSAGHTEIRFGARLTDLEQDAEGVSATYLGADGATAKLRAGFVVGADGPASTVRERCGIGMLGPAALGQSVNIHFRADLTAALRGRSVNMAMILNPAQPGLLLNIDGHKTWTAQAIVPAGVAPDFDEERSRAVVRAQVGDPELDVEILGIAPWTSAARVAEHLSSGRAFLVGDAAQEMPPAGGFGMNVGIQEADNLVWKLAAVIQDWAGAGLLDTYEAERLPIARQVTQEAMLNLKSVGRVESADGSPPQVKFGRPEFFHERGLVFGATYTSAAVISDGTQKPEVANEVSEYLPSATPGCRAPHLWIEVDGKRTSTLDISHAGFVLLRAGADSDAIVPPSGVPLRTVLSADPALAEAYGLAEGGAVLIRPDGHVAWRAREVAEAEEIKRALDSILDRAEVGVVTT